jgi:hypothetical protein
LASLDTLTRRDLPQGITRIVVDEAHHATAKKWRNVLDAYPNARVLGLTGTPVRLDGQPLGAVFEEMIESEPVESLIEQGWIARPSYWTPEWKVDLSRRSGNDFSDLVAAGMIPHSRVLESMVAEYSKHAAGLPALGFAATSEKAIQYAAHFNASGVAAGTLFGSDTDLKRRGTLARLRKGTLRVLWTCNVLGEGWDYPGLRCVMLARPTLSIARYLQQVARCMRPGVPPVVLDLWGAWSVFDPPWSDFGWSLQARSRKSRQRSKRDGTGAVIWLPPTEGEGELVLASTLARQTVCVGWDGPCPHEAKPSRDAFNPTRVARRQRQPWRCSSCTHKRLWSARPGRLPLPSMLKRAEARKTERARRFEIARAIRAEYALGVKLGDMADKFKLSTSAVRAIVRGWTWKDTKVEPTKIDQETAQSIRRMHAEGALQVELAERLGVSVSMINSIVLGRHKKYAYDRASDSLARQEVCVGYEGSECPDRAKPSLKALQPRYRRRGPWRCRMCARRHRYSVDRARGPRPSRARPKRDKLQIECVGWRDQSCPNGAKSASASQPSEIARRGGAPWRCRGCASKTRSSLVDVVCIGASGLPCPNQMRDTFECGRAKKQASVQGLAIGEFRCVKCSAAHRRKHIVPGEIREQQFCAGYIGHVCDRPVHLKPGKPMGSPRHLGELWRCRRCAVNHAHDKKRLPRCSARQDHRWCVQRSGHPGAHRYNRDGAAKTATVIRGR